MDSFKQSIAFWSTVLGTLLGFLGLVQSLSWLTALGLLLVAGSVGALAYAERQRQLLRLAALKVNGRSIDSLNVASLRRRLNRSLVIQDVTNVATISGTDLSLNWRCDGYCRVAEEGAIEFSIDADTNVPFERMECFGYDLRHDPNGRHRIRPILIGPDGISKKIAVPFLEPVRFQEPFSAALTCNLPGCMQAGVEYYTATLSFAQERVQRFVARLRFLDARPTWVRVYECNASGSVRLLKDLRPDHEDATGSEYLDTVENAPARTARIYVFHRAERDVAPAHEDLSTAA